MTDKKEEKKNAANGEQIPPDTKKRAVNVKDNFKPDSKKKDQDKTKPDSGKVTEKDKKNVKKPKGIEKVNTTKTLECYFTDDEKGVFAIDLARSTKRLEQLELRKKENAASIAADIAERKSASRLATKVNDGYELRDVKCTILKDFKKGVITITRNDTGEEVHKREMDEDEKQQSLI